MEWRWERFIYISCPELCFCRVWLWFFTFFEPLNGSGCPGLSPFGAFLRISLPVFLFDIELFPPSFIRMMYFKGIIRV
jgi:hypothetical protein